MMNGFRGGRIISKDGKKTAGERAVFNANRQNRTGHNGNGRKDIFNGGGLGDIKPTDNTRARLLEEISDAEQGRLINTDPLRRGGFYIRLDPESPEDKVIIEARLALLRAELDAHITGQPKPGDENPGPAMTGE